MWFCRWEIFIIHLIFAPNFSLCNMKQNLLKFGDKGCQNDNWFSCISVSRTLLILLCLAYYHYLQKTESLFTLFICTTFSCQHDAIISCCTSVSINIVLNFHFQKKNIYILVSKRFLTRSVLKTDREVYVGLCQMDYNICSNFVFIISAKKYPELLYW